MYIYTHRQVEKFLISTFCFAVTGCPKQVKSQIFFEIHRNSLHVQKARIFIFRYYFFKKHNVQIHCNTAGAFLGLIRILSPDMNTYTGISHLTGDLRMAMILECHRQRNLKQFSCGCSGFSQYTLWQSSVHFPDTLNFSGSLLCALYLFKFFYLLFYSHRSFECTLGA